MRRDEGERCSSAAAAAAYPRHRILAHPFPPHCGGEPLRRAFCIWMPRKERSVHLMQKVPLPGYARLHRRPRRHDQEPLGTDTVLQDAILTDTVGLVHLHARPYLCEARDLVTLQLLLQELEIRIAVLREGDVLAQFLAQKRALELKLELLQVGRGRLLLDLSASPLLLSVRCGHAVAVCRIIQRRSVFTFDRNANP